MPITPASLQGNELGKLRVAAARAVTKKWMDLVHARKDAGLTLAEREAMELERAQRDAEVILAFIQTNLLVTCPPGGGPGLVT